MVLTVFTGAACTESSWTLPLALSVDVLVLGSAYARPACERQEAAFAGSWLSAAIGAAQASGEWLHCLLDY